MLFASFHASAASAWLNADRPTPQALQMLEVLQSADRFGLRARDYALDVSSADMQLLGARADPALAARFDAELSRATGLFVSHLHCGRVSAPAAGFYLPDAPCSIDAEVAVRTLSAAHDVRAALTSFEPRGKPYQRLKQALAQYRELALRSDLVALPALPKRSLKVGDYYEGAVQLRLLLASLGDLDASAPVNPEEHNRIDVELSTAIAAFQSRHAIDADGVLGRRTFAALNTPLAQRVQQIELTLERWRWLGRLQRPDILVNVPHFMLYALPRPEHPDEELIEMRVIVGQSYRHTRTPMFVSAIQHVIFRPYWDVPASILQRELLPRIREDAGYLERHDMELVRGQGDRSPIVEATPEAIEALAAGELRLRQRPGPKNALGPIKFVLPNPFNVYLHATPEQRLFEHASRAFSHGCIRVSEPQRLALYVLRDNAPGDWDASRIETAMCADEVNVRVPLTKPVQVAIFYATAAATADGRVLFAEDLYGHDRRLAKLLQ